MGDLIKVVHVGSGDYGRVFCKIQITDGKLSISGVEGPRADGNCRGSCGQILDHLTVSKFAPGWDAEKLEHFRALWDRWHLNDMRAGCEHQRASWDTSREIEVVTYKLTTAAIRLREETIAAAAKAALAGTPFEPTAQARALAQLDAWYMPRSVPPDADSPLAGCYEVEKRETKTIGWVKPSEHPDGVLCKPCPTCGYKYGSAWLREELPEDVAVYFASLPETTVQPAWV